MLQPNNVADTARTANTGGAGAAVSASDVVAGVDATSESQHGSSGDPSIRAFDNELMSVLPRYPVVGRAASFNLIALAERLNVTPSEARKRISAFYDIDAWGAKHDELELSSDGEDQQAGERRGVSEKFSDFVLPSLDALPLIFDLPLKACAATLSPAAPRQRKRPRDSNDNGDDVDSARQSRPRIDRGGEAPAARERASSGDAASAVPGATVNTPGGVGATAATPTVSSARKPTPVGVLRPEALPQVATPVSREKKPAAAHRRDVKRSIAKPLLQDLPPRRRGSPRVGKVYSGRHRVYAMGPTSKDRISPS